MYKLLYNNAGSFKKMRRQRCHNAGAWNSSTRGSQLGFRFRAGGAYKGSYKGSKGSYKSSRSFGLGFGALRLGFGI